MKRLFIGLTFSDDFKKSVEPWIKKIRKKADQKEMSLHWTPPANYHLTLVFLGETAEEQIPKIEEKMRQVAARNSSFSLKIRNISGFPTLNQARVIYLGVQRSQSILDLQSDLEHELLPPDRAEGDYTPHMTLARLRHSKSCRDLLSPFEHIDLGKQPATSICLFSSVLAQGIPVYEVLFRIELRPALQPT